MESSDDDYSDDEDMKMDGALFTDSEDDSINVVNKANDDGVLNKNKKETILKNFSKEKVQNDFRHNVFHSLTNKARNMNNNHKRSKRLWKISASHARLTHNDKWFEINQRPTERCKRYRYSPRKGVWTEDIILIKIQEKPFSHGAMRECFLAKKLSNFSTKNEWSNATVCVVKRYMEATDKKSLFDDVRLQMDAKLWGEEFDKHQPPKKVDIMQMCVIEMIDREEQTFYHLENFIEGDYVKYNSNSGYVLDDDVRYTPQAFSHFTFECSHHKLIVVDIQGVGDLWTDPQIHTYKGTEYGSGNLGTRGMALFFYSHKCNKICESLNLSPFDLSFYEINLKKESRNNSERRGTLPTGCEEPLQLSLEKETFLNEINEEDEEGQEDYLPPRCNEEDDDDYIIEDDLQRDVIVRSDSGDVISCASSGYGSTRRTRYISGMSDHQEYHEMLISPPPLITVEVAKEEKEDSKESNEDIKNVDAIESYRFGANRLSRRASCVYNELKTLKIMDKISENHIDKQVDEHACNKIKSHTIQVGQSILGKIHYDMVVYYDCGRFEFDEDSSFYHLQIAADCGSLEAIQNISKIYMGLPRDMLSDLKFEMTDENKSIGFSYMNMAADAGDKHAMFTVAKCYFNGIGLPSDKTKNGAKALKLFNKILEDDSSLDAENNFDDVLSRLAPRYEVLSYKAQIYFHGCEGVAEDKNLAGELYTSAAEDAMKCGKGKLATKYYMQAEECWYD